MKGTETSTFGTNGRVNHNSEKFYNSKLYSGLEQTAVLEKEEIDFPVALENTILWGSSENMAAIPDNSLHLMITSPPYNVSKEYDEDLVRARNTEHENEKRQKSNKKRNKKKLLIIKQNIC